MLEGLYLNERGEGIGGFPIRREITLKLNEREFILVQGIHKISLQISRPFVVGILRPTTFFIDSFHFIFLLVFNLLYNL